MKKTPLAINRGKPPSVRPPHFHSSKSRTFINERPGHHLPTLQLGPERLISMSENPEIGESPDGAQPLQFSSKEVSDCMANWLNFLKVLQTLCTAGSQLVNSMNALSSGSTKCKSRIEHCKAMWEHLSHATASAASVIRNQTIASLQEAHIAPEIDSDQAETNQNVVCSGMLRLLNLQYQFSVATCDWAHLQPKCGCILPTGQQEAVARCFASRQPIAPPQRRWSEVASHAERGPPEVRRWSIPWKLALPTGPGDQRSRSTTPDAAWHTALATQEDLDEVISLLSNQPFTASIPHSPSVTSTRSDSRGTDNINKGFPHRGSWWGEGEDMDRHSLTSRKSSSSTDSSSCFSGHIGHSSSEESHLSHRGGGPQQMYSMWSGDVPFIKLPESAENPEP